MNYPINKKVIVRTKSAGVFFGTLGDYDPQTYTAEIRECRRIWYWSGAASLSQMALEGVKCPRECKFTVTLQSIQVMEVVEILPCTDDAVKNIERVPVWRKQ